MKLRNKKTGEIKDLDIRLLGAEPNRFVDSLAELNEEWEDYEEPKSIYNRITWYGDEIHLKFNNNKEASEFYDKLKAWKRLKDKGFEFTGWKETFWGDYTIEAEDYTSCDDKDLDLLFGGEE